MSLLEVKNLKVYYFTEVGVVKAIDNISLSVRKGESLGVVGESGSGKSTLASAILRLIPPPGRIVDGKIFFDNIDLTSISEEEMRRIRGKRISMVFQDPMTSLNPLQRVGDHLIETIMTHEKVEKEEAKNRALKLFSRVGIPSDRFKDYPHQFSGGMRQRVMIALALALNPDLILADEPTTALDVIIQAQILDLLKDLMESYKVSLILISHDLCVVAEVVKKIAVMYAGQILELSDVNSIFNEPLHPYTMGLLGSIPNIELEKQELKFIPGFPPDMVNPPPGCRFHPRCPKAMDTCRVREPPMIKVGENRYVKCFLYGD